MPEEQARRERTLTVVKVRMRDDRAEVMFAESARIYRVLRTQPRYEQTVRELASAVGRRVRVRLEAPDGDVIEDATKDVPPNP
jgi:hypothetical protein